MTERLRRTSQSLFTHLCRFLPVPSGAGLNNHTSNLLALTSLSSWALAFTLDDHPFLQACGVLHHLQRYLCSGVQSSAGADGPKLQNTVWSTFRLLALRAFNNIALQKTKQQAEAEKKKASASSVTASDPCSMTLPDLNGFQRSILDVMLKVLQTFTKRSLPAAGSAEQLLKPSDWNVPLCVSLPAADAPSLKVTADSSDEEGCFR